MKKIVILLVFAGLFLAVSGCTESAPEAPAATPVPTTVKTPVPTYHPTTAMPTLEQTPLVNDYTITITREGFNPESITVKRGATVRWVNADSTEDPMVYNPTHRIKIPNVKTGQTISPGQGWSWVFVNQGVYNYEDMIHPDLKGTVTVQWE